MDGAAKLKECFAVSVHRREISMKHLSDDRNDVVATLEERYEVRRLAGFMSFESHQSDSKFDYLLHDIVF